MSCASQAQLEGLTGKIRFEKRGKRESFGLDLMELTIDGLKKVRMYVLTSLFCLDENRSKFQLTATCKHNA